MKLFSFCYPVKDNLGLRKPGIYRIPTDCGRVYIVQTGCSIYIRLSELQRHVRLDHLDMSAVAEHNISQEHGIQFHSGFILATKTRYMVCIVREAIETNSTLTI
jgi:hypothetical protein